MKTILALFLALTGFAVTAAPQFLPLPGTPEGDATAASKAPAPAAAPIQPATNTAAQVAETKPTAPVVAAPAPVVPPAAPTAPTAAPAAAMPTLPTPTSRVVPRRFNSPATPAAAPAPAPAPAASTVPGLSAGAATNVGAAKLLAANADDILPAGTIQFQATPLEQVLEIYAKLVNRTILRPASLPAAAITIKTQTELTKSEALQALDSVLGMNGITMIPIGTKFVKAVPVGEANQAGAAIENQADGDNLPQVGGYRTHVVQMKYAKPSEVMPVLAPFAKIQGNITALDANGILIIRDYTENVKRMLELIAQIDVTVPSEFVSEVIPIKYALASDIANALNSVGGSASGSIGSSGSTAGAAAGVTGRSSAFGSRSGTSSSSSQPFGSSATTTSPFGNRSPMTSGGATTPGGGAAPSFSDRLRSIISRAATPGGGDFQLIGPNKIIPDERTNSLLVFASRQDLDMIKSIIEKLDVVLAQVLIESVILDVTLADNFNFSVSAGQAPLHDGNLSGGGSINNGNSSLATGMSFLNNLIPSFVTNITSTATNISTIFNQSTNVNFPSSDGLTYFGKLNPTWNVALSALAGKNNVKVLARPSIQTSQNAPASIFVGETRPYITGTYYDGYNSGSRSQYQQSQIGITLNVTPLINPDGLVVMDIQQQVQQVGGSVKIDGNDVPITQDQNATSKVAVRNGETIVMGGFIQNQKSETKSGIPYLQDIPWLGALFRSTSTTGARRELLVMIRPTVLPTPEAAALQTQVQRDRHPNLKMAEADFNKEDVKLLKRANRLAKPQPADKKIAEAADKAAAEADKAAALAEARASEAADKAAEAEAKADAAPAAPQDDKP